MGGKIFNFLTYIFSPPTQKKKKKDHIDPHTHTHTPLYLLTTLHLIPPSTPVSQTGREMVFFLRGFFFFEIYCGSV